eukprot:5750539-Heterocapsa_arctica.AAC.1
MRAHMADLNKQLFDTNEKWKNKVGEIAGINLELAGLGWAQMDGDSDFEEEETEQEVIDQGVMDQ